MAITRRKFLSYLAVSGLLSRRLFSQEGPKDKPSEGADTFDEKIRQFTENCRKERDRRTSVLNEKRMKNHVQDNDKYLKSAIEKGMDWLSKNQKEDGSFGDNFKIGITSLCGLAFMANGSLPERGKYKENVSKTLDFIVSNQGRSGYIVNKENSMHSHGYATLFLSELYGMTKNEKPEKEREEFKWKIKKAVEIIEASQGPSGGWFYYPARIIDNENSITIAIVQALRSARNAGIKVEKETINRAINYIKSCSMENGGMRYSSTDKTDKAGFALTAAGVSALNSLGDYNSYEVKKGLEYIKKVIDNPNNTDSDIYEYYEDFYSSLALWNAGGEDWTIYYPKIKAKLLRGQEDDGNWKDHIYGDDYSTAMALLTLGIPNKILPAFQRAA